MVWLFEGKIGCCLAQYLPQQILANIWRLQKMGSYQTNYRVYSTKADMCSHSITKHECIALDLINIIGLKRTGLVMHSIIFLSHFFFPGIKEYRTFVY